jgi:hypothetical protein
MNGTHDSSSQPEREPDAPALGRQQFTVLQHLLPGTRPTYRAVASDNGHYGVVTIIDGLAVQASSPDVFYALAEIFEDAARELTYAQAEIVLPAARS